MNEEKDTEYEEYAKDPVFVATDNVIKVIIETLGGDFDHEKLGMTVQIISLVINFFAKKIDKVQISHIEKGSDCLLSKDNEIISKYFVKSIVSNLAEIQKESEKMFHKEENKDSNIVH